MKCPIDSPDSGVGESCPSMLKYLYRDCPKCGDYLGVVVPDPPESKREVPIDAYCCRCGFKLGWKVVLGNKGLA